MTRTIAAVVVSGLVAALSTYLSAKAVLRGGFGFFYSVTTTMVSVSYAVFGVALYALLERFRGDSTAKV